MATAVTVYRTWWRQDDFHSEGRIVVNVLDGGTLVVSFEGRTRYYASGHWKKMHHWESVPSRAKV